MDDSDNQTEKHHRMLLKDWDIWHSYLNYFIEDFGKFDLKDMAKVLIQSHLCAVVYHSDNQIWWMKDQEIENSTIDLKREGEKWEIIVNTSNFENLERNYAFEGAIQAAEMRTSEIKLFSPQYLETFSYIRCYLNVIYIGQSERIISLYPILKIYNNGVIILSFRVIAPDGHLEYPIDTFIEYDINLFKHRADFIEVAPELIKAYIKSQFLRFDKNIMSRNKTLSHISEIDSLINSKIKEIDDGNFTFYMVHLDNSFDNSGFVPSNFNDIKEMIISSIYHIINQTNTGKIYLFFGPGTATYHISEKYLSRPSIYILDFANQPETSEEITENFKEDLGTLMSRTSRCVYPDKFFGPNLRHFDDYTLHINEALTLWVLSKKGHDANECFEDPNRGHLIYEKQVLAESIDYIHTSYRRNAERSYFSNISYKSSIKEQLDMIKLNDILRHTCYAGELNEFHDYASRVFGLSALLENSMNNLKLKMEFDQIERNERFLKIGLIVSILFGLSNLPTFTDGMTKPAWLYFDLWLPTNNELQQLFFITITAVIFFILIYIILWINNYTRRD